MERGVLAAEAFPDQYEAARQRAAAMLGGLAIRGEQSAPVEADEPNDSTLLADVQGAALGDEFRRGMVRRNVATDVGERLYKTANVSKVDVHISDGEIWQGQRAMSDVSRNTLTQTVLKLEPLERTVHELTNNFFVGELQATGALRDNVLVVWSTAPTRMSTKEKKEYNFFTDTESISVQALWLDGDRGELQTAMVAGKATTDSKRHDITTIQKVAAELDIPLTEEDGTGMLRHSMLIAKAAMPNGIVDLVKLFDTAAGGTFYGEAKPQQDYLEHAAMCDQRNRSFDHIVEQVTARLIAESHNFRSPIDAIMRLDKLSEEYCVQYAVDHRDVEAAVFGKTAAMHIEEARFFIDQGEYSRAYDSLRKAQETAVSGSCPLFKGSDSDGDDNPDGRAGASTREVSMKKAMNCPFCKAFVFDDPCAKRLICRDCHAKVQDGSVRSTGDGGSRARDERRRAEARKQAIASLKMMWIRDDGAGSGQGGLNGRPGARAGAGHAGKMALAGAAQG